MWENKDSRQGSIKECDTMRISLELQPCLKNKSGIGIYTYELAKRLQYYPGCDLTGDIFNFLNRNNIVKDVAGLNFNKRTCTLFPYGIYRRIWHKLPIKYNDLFKDKVELYHFFNFIVPPRIEGKVINTIHDLTFLLYPDTMSEANLKRITQDIEYSIKRSDKIVTISQSSKRDLISKLHILSKDIEVIYPGVDYELFAAKCSEEEVARVRMKYHLPTTYVLYMGTLEPRKNIESIIKAFSLLRQQTSKDMSHVKLVLAGKKGWMYDSIFEQVETLGLKDEVIFTDYVAEEDKPIIYSQAKVFVFPSLYEGFGIPPLEAMAASVPVITSNVSSLPEVAGDAALMVEPTDTSALASHMYDILTNEAYAKLLVQRGLVQAKKFNWNDSVKQLYALYESVIAL